MLRFLTARVLSLGLLILIAGCSSPAPTGPKTVPASGKVTYKNLPVEGATVSFLGDGNTMPAVGITDSAGEFVLKTVHPKDGALPGIHRVTVTKFAASAPKVKSNVTMEEAAKSAQEPPSTPVSILPERYSSAETSDLQYEVKASGPNKFEIPLTD